MLLPRVPGPPAQPWGCPRPPRAESSPPPPRGATWRGGHLPLPRSQPEGKHPPYVPPSGSPLGSPKLTPVLAVVDPTVILGEELGPPQHPRKRQQPRSAAQPGQGGGLHPRGVGGQRDGGGVVREVLRLELVLEGGGEGREQSRRARGQGEDDGRGLEGGRASREPPGLWRGHRIPPTATSWDWWGAALRPFPHPQHCGLKGKMGTQGWW